jgi:lysophospholipase L1-like esterase
MKRLMLKLAVVLALCIPVAFGGEIVVEDFENLEGWTVVEGKSSGMKEAPTKFEKAPDAAVGEGAIKVTLPGQVWKKLWPKYPPLENIAWDSYAGVSFRVKGDGSDYFGCISLGDGPGWGYIYIYFFPLKDTEWRTYTVAWEDLIPENEKPPLGARGSLSPCGISHIRFGDRWNIQHNNYPVPEHSFSVDQIVLVEKIERAATVPPIRPLAEVAQLLKEKKPVTILCQGDSITAGTSLKDRDNTRYATQMQKLLRAWFGYDEITVVSHAVGGSRMINGRAWLPRDFAGIEPDLVTTLYGYNEKSGGQSVEYFKYSLNDYVDRIARLTGGKAAIMPLATIPGLRNRYTMMDDYADAVREVAAARGLTCFDLQKEMKTYDREKIEELFADMAHPNEKGHLYMATKIAGFLAKLAGKTDAELVVPDGMIPEEKK